MEYEGNDLRMQPMKYVTCNHKKNRARVSLAVCAKCKRRGRCSDYLHYFQLPLFPSFFKYATQEPYRRDTGSRRIRPVPRKSLVGPKQLTLIP